MKKKSKKIVVACTGSDEVDIEELVPFQGDLKDLSEENYGKLKKQIIELGFSSPIHVWDHDGAKNILDGHQRLRAVKRMVEEGYACPEIPIVSVKAKDHTQAKLKVLALTSQYGEMTRSGLDSFLSDIGISFEEAVSNFRFPEIDFGTIKPETTGLTDDDAIPEEVDPICKPGQLWKLGEHRLLCGDCTIKENVERLMAGEKADMVFTDPPYNHASDEKLISQSVSQAMKKLAESEWDKGFSFTATAKIILQFVAENSTVYVCTSWHLAGEIWEWMRKHSSHNSYCVWHKPNPMPSLMKRHWTWASELICYATFGKHVFNFPKEGHASNVWSINKNAKNDLHPTMKPVEISEKAIIHSSNAGSIVLDLFLGSGSTLIACEKTGRRCYGMEIDPHYCDVIIKRWQDYTGKDAKLIKEKT